MDMYLMVEGVRYFVALFFGFQSVNVFGALILGKVIIEYHEWGIYPEPRNSLEKGQNLFMYGFAGYAVYTYRKTEQEFSNWFVRKAVQFLGLVAVVISGVVAYYATYGTLKFIVY